MPKKNIKISVEGREITISDVQGGDYISLTDMVTNIQDGSKIIENWLRTRSTLSFLGAWEKVHNASFNSLNFEGIMRYAGDMNFTISVKKWTKETEAIGIKAKAGRYGGTYAHSDIAFEFAMAISPMFKVLLVKEFQRLKQEEYSRQKLEWNYHRFLTKVNYRLHTDTIKEHIIPKIQEQRRNIQEWVIYAEEADLLNMAIFGMTAKQWREQNPEQADKGNIRDFSDVVQLNVLANLESVNAVLIERGLTKGGRFEILAQAAISQYKRLTENDLLKQIEH